jgi:lipoate---protein ligase
MTLDRWLFDQHRIGNFPSVLRFYTWDPVTISLGYNQKQYPDFWHHLTWNGKPLDLVRRPTGGRAVLHQGDLSYLIVTSDLKGNRREIYQKLSQFLITGWRSLGVNLIYGETERGYIHNPSCFSTSTKADLLTANRQKLIGSAQLRQGKTILQHGSMNLATDPQL